MKTFNAIVRMLTVAALVAAAASAAAQQVYPSRPIRFICPFAPGGASAVLARLVGQKMTESWGQQVLVENRGGGETIIGSDAAAKSAPDGYTVLLSAPTVVLNAVLYPKLPYDPIRDFAPIGTLTSFEYFLVIHPSLPANNLQELIALAKSKPGQLNYSTSGTVMHVVSEQFNILAGTKIQHVPYKGGGPAITDLIGGQVQMTFGVPTNVIGHVKSGRLRGIAVSGKRRLPAMPQIPTFTEAGLPGFNVTSWYGVLAPAGTPKEIVYKLSIEVGRILALPDIREKLDSQGFEPYISSSDEFAALMKVDLAKFAKVVKAANIKLEN